MGILFLKLIKFIILNRFPEIISISNENNDFLLLPHSGEIPFDSLLVEQCVKASGKLSIDLEHFIDDFSLTLKEEFADKGFLLLIKQFF